MATLPRLVAICGNPNAGKTTVQRLLFEHFDYVPADDARALREIAIQYLGLTAHQVSTQEGKDEYVDILGRYWEVRNILGTLGNKFEEMFGDFAMPWMAMKGLDGGRYSFGSVRRTQGAFYKRLGGIVIGIRNPLAPESRYEFDRFDHDLVDYWIDNDAISHGMSSLDAMADLEAKVTHLFKVIIPNGERS